MMYIDKVFVYLLIAVLLMLILLLWRNERKISKLEVVVSMLNKHNSNTDAILRSMVNILDNFFKGMVDVTSKNKKEESSTQ